MKVIFAESCHLDRPDQLESYQYIRLFQKGGHECLWLGATASPTHLFKTKILNRDSFRAWWESRRQVGGIVRLMPLSIPDYHNLPLIRNFFAGCSQYRACLPSLERQLKKAGFVPADLLWCTGPTTLDLLDLVPHRVSCYWLADRQDQDDMIPPNVAEQQEKLIKRVDFVLAASHSLLERAHTVREGGVHYLPDGVSEIFFEPAGPPPEDFPTNGLPVVVCVGDLDNCFDMKLLAHAVYTMKDLHFLIIGRLTFEDLKPRMLALLDEDNFTWLGAREHKKIPAYLQHSDVGIIPLCLTDLSTAVNPLKYFEFVACGLPVVAPPQSKLTILEGPLYTYRNRDDIYIALKKALSVKEGGQSNLADYINQYTWKSRFEKIIEIVEDKRRVSSGLKIIK